MTTITREKLRPYANLGKSNNKIQDHICELLFRLIQTDDPKKVKELCESEIEWLVNEYDKPSTRTSYVSAYRKSIHSYFDQNPIPQSLKVEKQTTKGLVTNHLAESYLMAPSEDYDTVRKTNKSKTAIQRDNLTPFNAKRALEATKEALNSDDWREVAVGLIMAVQSRPSDMLKSGDFKSLTKYRLEFKSRAKKRGSVAKGKVFCLVDSSLFINAFNRLRREPDVINLRGYQLKDIDSAKNSSLNRAVKRIYGDIIPVPYGEKELSCKNLRASGVNIAYWLHGKETQSLGRFAELQLLHDNPGTAANYEDFYCVDSAGKKINEVGALTDEELTVKPDSEKRSSLSLDKQLLEMIADANQWGEGSHADRLERIIARAKEADKLEALLARECEKRQKLELQLHTKSGLTPIEVEPIKDTKLNYRDMPNSELSGCKNHDAYPEKLRRTVEAIQEYNAGRELKDHFSITGSILRQITGSKPALVKKWMEENEAALSSYNASYPSRQNVGKPDPRKVIEWSKIYDN